jgi:hypothetical protein
MTSIYEWLENIDPLLTAPSLEPMDRTISAKYLVDQITPLDIDEDSNWYFSMPPAWDAPPDQPQVSVEPIPIDPSLRTVTNTLAPTTSGQSIVTVPEHLAEASSKILIYLAQILEVPDDPADLDDGPTEETTFTAEELEALEPIDEDEFEPAIPDVINGVYVNKDPQPTEIEEVIDLRRIGPSRQIFYLARSIDGNYYWFHVPRAERDHKLRQLIGDYRHKSRAEADGRKGRGGKKLRNGKTVRM